MVIRKCRGYEVEITNEFAYFFDHTGTDFQVNKNGEIFYLDPSGLVHKASEIISSFAFGLFRRYPTFSDMGFGKFYQNYDFAW